MSTPAPLIPLDSHIVRTLQYQIRQQLDAPRCKILECYDISHVSKSEQFGQFLQQCEQKNIIHVFIPVNELHQPLSDLFMRGIRVNPRVGLKIRADHINIDRNKEFVDLVHCIVILGSSQNHQYLVHDYRANDFETSIPNPDKLMHGYQSFRISNDSLYYIFNPNQIRTLHIIRIAGGTNLNKNPEFSNECQVCQNSEAQVYCTQCSARLCSQCNETTHTSNVLLNSHERIPIQNAQMNMEMCPYHPKNRAEHFCPICQIPVCYECKLTGNHSSGESAKHQLILLKDAYYEALQKVETENRSLFRRKRIINEKLHDAAGRLKAIEENARTIEDRIMEIAKQAISSLHQQVGERALMIRSTQSELMRKQSEIEEKDGFIKQIRDLNGPVSFIQSMKIYEELILTEMKQELDLPPNLWVDGDLAVTGGIYVKPRSQTKLPEGTKKRDLEFEERDIRVTDIPTETTNADENLTADSKVTTQLSQTQDRPKPKHIYLSKMATKREQKMISMGKRIAFSPFSGSQILTDSEKAYTLYLSLPFKSFPQTHLLFSTERDGRSFKLMHRLIDNVGISAVIVRRGTHIFGGFAAAKWNCSGEPFGFGSSSFLFQLNKDVFLPFKASFEDTVCLFANNDVISFGREDLVLGDNFNNCRSHIEHSYTAGFRLGDEECSTFLSGSEYFKADCVEIWGFFSQDK